MLKWDTQIFSSISYPTQSLAKNQSISQSIYKFKLRGLKKKEKKSYDVVKHMLRLC